MTAMPCSVTPAPWGFEGIVAKRRDKPYRSWRTPHWIKVKNPDAPAATRLIEG
jgi:ATP-dependent DNA ligase